MPRRAAPHRGVDVHYGDAIDGVEDADARPSKSQLKRESHDLQALGLEVAELSADRLAKIEMPEALRDAIAEFRRTKTHEGRRRQLQYVGKLMRSADEDVLREAVAEAKLGSARETLALHETERWRAELIGNDEAITRFLHAHPETDTQQLRSLVRAARRDSAPSADRARESGDTRQPRSHRELFQFLKPLLQA